MDLRKFLEIQKEYDRFYASLLRSGRLPLRSTEKGFWGHVPAQDLYRAFGELGLKNDGTFIDLGSGDGKAVLIASLFCKRAIGIEIDRELFNKSLEIQKRLNATNALFYNADFYEHALTGFDTVFVYPDEPMRRKLEDKLSRELSGRLLHCGHHFHPERLKLERKIAVNGNLFSIYTRG